MNDPNDNTTVVVEPDDGSESFPWIARLENEHGEALAFDHGDTPRGAAEALRATEPRAKNRPTKVNRPSTPGESRP